MRLASYVPGELIPLPLSGSIPELPHVAKVGGGRWMPVSIRLRATGFDLPAPYAGYATPTLRGTQSVIRPAKFDPVSASKFERRLTPHFRVQLVQLHREGHR
jgi:hypothetical protein